MKCNYACGSMEHGIARRQFLGTLAAGTGAVVGGLGWFAQSAAANQLAKEQKRMLVINMHGGLSQLESWDPKPNTNTGGPFRAIPTSVPGLHISELLPYTAKQMHHLALIRGINTKNEDHGKGTYQMLTGYHERAGIDYPQIGAVVAKSFDTNDRSLPGHILITPGGAGGRSADSAYLGPKYSSVVLGNGNPPQNTALPAGLAAATAEEQQTLRRLANDRFLGRRRTAQTDAYVQSFEAAQDLMKQREVFDLTKEPEKDHERYGKYDFGRHCLMARRLLEKGITFVQISHSNYDTHNENFNFHFEQMGEFDRPFATLIQDLHERGMLANTLVVVLSEFGRTPNINQYYGRDHWGRAWSVCLGGAGIARGAVFGKTNATGTEVTEHQVDAGNLFHTYLRGLGLNSRATFDVGGRRVPVADPAFGPITELIA
ncbi:MAG: DUF1501 domain-containing protein [Pedosphaera sp.]|nr:DUF1501 domain-containing protein [Pedosphaera sp.]